MTRIVTVAAAQLGPIQRADSRSDVVRRLIELMRQAKGMGADLVVFPELGLTTFFPRWFMADQAEIDAFFERAMPGPETQPLFDDTTLMLRADGLYHSKSLFTVNALTETYADKSNSSVTSVNGFWLINARMALRHLKIGPADAELALWGKNLTDNKDPVFVLITPLATSANYGPSRTYGIELSVEF